MKVTVSYRCKELLAFSVSQGAFSKKQAKTEIEWKQCCMAHQSAGQLNNRVTFNKTLNNFNKTPALNTCCAFSQDAC